MLPAFARATRIVSRTPEHSSTIRLYGEPKVKPVDIEVGGVSCLLYCWSNEEWLDIPEAMRPSAEARRLPNMVRLLIRDADNPLLI